MIYYVIPLIIIFSICYAATRHEDLRKIFPHAAWICGWLLFFFALVCIILQVVAWYG
ncbi:MAG: hypothetical protein LBL39_03520 [Planctomycetaceae bacterium]|nr:hypothetical protein [Planctomycetaceae bacterium]